MKEVCFYYGENDYWSGPFTDSLFTDNIPSKDDFVSFDGKSIYKVITVHFDYFHERVMIHLKKSK